MRDGEKYRWLNGKEEGWTEKRGWMDGGREGCVDGRTDGRKEIWPDGRKRNKKIKEYTNENT